MTRMTSTAATAALRPDQGPGVDETLPEGELATLVRRWVAAGTRARRESALHVAPAPTHAPAPAPAREPDGLSEGDAAGISAEAAEDRAEVPSPTAAGPGPAAVPRLPQRPTGEETAQAFRLAVLIDARRVPADVATGLLGLLAERGSITVCRAYADWGRTELGDWAGRMRREGLHSFHHFPEDDEQALVAMAIDAVDIARDASVDEVVLAGDLTSALPLVHRLHAAGVRVVAVGSGHTPHDVRAACDEFVDTASVDGSSVVPAGRHRA